MSIDQVAKYERTVTYSKPYLTYAILILILCIFIIEQIAAVEPADGFLNPTITTLTALGSLDWHRAIDEREWWRIFLAPLLHAGPLHIFFNSIALLIAGMIAERIIGIAWFGAAFVVSALSGAFMSLARNPTDIISVGVSGAIMGLFAMIFVTALRFPSGSPTRKTMQSGALQVLIPSLLPVWTAISGQKVDLNAHFGGVIGGVLIGTFLLILWPKQQRYPSLRYVAAIIGAIGLVGFSYGAFRIAYDYRTYSLYEALIPAHELLDDKEGRAKSETLTARYPQDPRSHFFRALALRDRRNMVGFKNEIYEALKLDKVIKTFFKPDFETRLRVMLAMQLQTEGDREEAIKVAQPICKISLSYKSVIDTYRLCSD